MCNDIAKWNTETVLQGCLTNTQRDWLFNRESLTKRCTALSGGQFSVSVLSEKLELIREDEAIHLAADLSKPLWVREVVLQGCDQAWIYARSISLAKTEFNEKPFLNVGGQALGNALFSNNAFVRSQIEVSVYPQSYLPNAFQFNGLWARRSIFQNSEMRILVQEIFLPEFWMQFKADLT